MVNKHKKVWKIISRKVVSEKQTWPSKISSFKKKKKYIYIYIEIEIIYIEIEIKKHDIK